MRAWILGLLGAVAIAGVGYVNDSVLQFTRLVSNHLPISVFGLLIVLVVGVNPLLGLLGKRRRLQPAELAVIVALMLVACSIPGSGLMRTFVPALAMPAHYNAQLPGWQKAGVLSYVPPRLLAGGGRYEPAVVEGLFAGGAPDSAAGIGLGGIPWAHWWPTLSVWIPVIFLLGIATLCIALVVHPQWSRRERLRYPVVQFARALSDPGGDRGGSVLRRGAFWVTLAIILAIHAVNGLNTWKVFDFEIPLNVDLRVLGDTWPVIEKFPMHVYLLEPKLILSVAAFSFFLATDVALSLGISFLAFAGMFLVLVTRGVAVSTDDMMGGGLTWQFFGSGLGLAMIVLYTGRRHYGGVLKRALTFRRLPGVENYSVWAARVGFLAAAGAVAILIGQGLAAPFAILLVGLILLLFTIVGRINVETGLIFIQLYWHPLPVFVGLFGAAALGPGAMATIGLLCAVLTIDPRECLMPFVLNGLKLSDDAGVRPARMGLSAGMVLAVSLAVATPVVLWANYNYGIPEHDLWAKEVVPQKPFKAVVAAIGELKDATPDELNLEQSRSLGTWERLGAMRPDPDFLKWAGLGLAAVLVLSFLRLRYTWWPLHPIFLVLWGTYPMANLYPSFLVGWLIKAGVMHLGGGKAYTNVKPVMIGVVAGELLAGFLFAVAGAIYYALTGVTPEQYAIFPG